MLSAYTAGRDLHTLTARTLTGREEVTKDDRKLAKAVNFGLLYGMGGERASVLRPEKLRSRDELGRSRPLPQALLRNLSWSKEMAR
jgi:hypothetical protein